MCGLFAMFDVRVQARREDPLAGALTRMWHRGPDAEGVWREPSVALGHRRLAIIDLDERAAQPMHSSCGRYVIVFNGEIYNYAALRSELQAAGVDFRTTSDTEVLLALFARDGDAMLPKLHGMFAFLIWDRIARRAFAARDPYGIKPLYFAETPEGVLVASQVKALLATGMVSREPCAQGQAGFWMLGSVPEPYTWYKHIRALPAGYFMWVENGRIHKQHQWYDIGAAWRESAPDVRINHAEVQAQVREALKESVKRHMVADVPVGVFLSGGIDSGALAGLMSELGAGPIEGVTLCYDEFLGKADDEAPMARLLANHYGIRHTLRRVTREEFLNDLPRILNAMDQPSIDGVNTWYASKAVAERGLKVVVSGVGGDELFQGYSHFRTLPRLMAARRMASWLPGGGSAIDGIGYLQARRSGKPRWNHLREWSCSVEGAWWLRRSIHAPEELAGLMNRDLAHEALTGFDVVEEVRRIAGQLPSDPLLAIGQIESTAYLRNQLLRDSDWASMDHSVELRTPLVDAHLLKAIGSLLPQFLQFPHKSLLASAPKKPLPQEAIRRPKTGFSIPVQGWAATAESSPGWQIAVSRSFA